MTEAGARAQRGQKEGADDEDYRVERVRKQGKQAQLDPNVLMAVQMRISEAVQQRFEVTDDQVMAAVEAFEAKSDPSFKGILERIASTLSSALG